MGCPRHTHHASPVHEPPAAIRATGIIVVLTVVLAILAIAFALPAARSKPHDVPIGAAGPMAAGIGLGTPPWVGSRRHPRAARSRRVRGHLLPGEAALRDAIRNRDVYGGISFGAGPNVAGQAAPEGRTLLIATGGSPMVAQMLTQIGNGIPSRPACRCTPRTSPRRPPTTRAAPAWQRRRCRSPWPACCPRSRSSCSSSARCGRASPPRWCSPR